MGFFSWTDMHFNRENIFFNLWKGTLKYYEVEHVQFLSVSRHERWIGPIYADLIFWQEKKKKATASVSHMPQTSDCIPTRMTVSQMCCPTSMVHVGLYATYCAESAVWSGDNKCAPRWACSLHMWVGWDAFSLLQGASKRYWTFPVQTKNINLSTSLWPVLITHLYN